MHASYCGSILLLRSFVNIPLKDKVFSFPLKLQIFSLLICTYYKSPTALNWLKKKKVLYNCKGIEINDIHVE